MPTTRPFKPLTYKGMLLEGIASADAQVLIAFGPEETWDGVLANPISRAPSAPSPIPTFREQKWEQVRREGVAFDRGEWNSTAPAVAAPVFDRIGHMRASVSVVARPSDAARSRCRATRRPSRARRPNVIRAGMSRARLARSPRRGRRR